MFFFQKDDGSVPSLDWLDSLPAKVQDKFVNRIKRLSECGHELRRPEAGFLRDGIYELRVRHMRVNYRLLYFFSKGDAVLSQGVQKKDKVPDREIELAKNQKQRFEKNAEKHTYFEYEN